MPTVPGTTRSTASSGPAASCAARLTTRLRGSRSSTKSSAEFGCFLQAAHNWADFEATEKSYELYARSVVPHFRQPDVNRAASHAWTLEHTKDFNARREKPA